MAAPENRVVVDPACNGGVWFGLKRQCCFVSDQGVSKINLPFILKKKTWNIDIIEIFLYKASGLNKMLWFPLNMLVTVKFPVSASQWVRQARWIGVSQGFYDKAVSKDWCDEGISGVGEMSVKWLCLDQVCCEKCVWMTPEIAFYIGKDSPYAQPVRITTAHILNSSIPISFKQDEF